MSVGACRVWTPQSNLNDPWSRTVWLCFWYSTWFSVSKKKRFVHRGKPCKCINSEIGYISIIRASLLSENFIEVVALGYHPGEAGSERLIYVWIPPLVDKKYLNIRVCVRVHLRACVRVCAIVRVPVRVRACVFGLSLDPWV